MERDLFVGTLHYLHYLHYQTMQILEPIITSAARVKWVLIIIVDDFFHQQRKVTLYLGEKICQRME
jgi:hypothetical protein